MTEVVLGLLREASVRSPTPNRLRRAPVLTGLVGACALAVAFTWGDPGTSVRAAVNTSQLAATTTTFSSARAHVRTASYFIQNVVPIDNCSPGTCIPLAETEPISVTVGQPGSFTVTVTARAMTLIPSVHPLVFRGKLPQFKVSDSRTTLPGWSVSGQVSDFTGTGPTAHYEFSGNQLGWTPLGDVQDGATLGPPVEPANPGLGSTAAVLASAGAGSGFGKNGLRAKVLVAIPSSVPAGPYSVTITITSVSSEG